MLAVLEASDLTGALEAVETGALAAVEADCFTFTFINQNQCVHVRLNLLLAALLSWWSSRKKVVSKAISSRVF